MAPPDGGCTMTATLSIQASRRYGTLSPLRYPGGKAALAGLFADVIAGLELRDATYIEPYAGGAGAGIALLREGRVSQLVINDIDPAVHAFWRSVVDRNDVFLERVEAAPLTVEYWRSQRDVYRSRTSDVLDLGFAFFYLNRTNRSGVLNAGVIGGQAQTGNYKIDARFNRATLVDRLSAIGDLASKIQVTALDGRTLIREHAADRSAFMYIDPPYVTAGSDLYMNSFDAADHTALAKIVGDIGEAHWLLTYDQHSLIRRLYGNHFQCELALTYSARHPGKATELLIASPEVATLLREPGPTPAAQAGTAAEARST